MKISMKNDVERGVWCFLFLHGPIDVAAIECSESSSSVWRNCIQKINDLSSLLLYDITHISTGLIVEIVDDLFCSTYV